MSVANAIVVKFDDINKKLPTNNYLTNKSLLADIDIKNSKSFNSGSETYFVVKNAYASDSAADNGQINNKKTNSIQNTQSVNYSKQLGRFKIIIPNNKNNMANLSANSLSDNNNYGVVYNKRTNNLAVIVGNIIVKFKDDNYKVQDIANSYGLVIKADFKHLNTAFFSIIDGQNIIDKANILSNDDSIYSATVEVLENINIPL